ncbi:MAG: prefoldin subunit [Candidatus Heimdallarchaeaceae archaeon]
MSFQPKLSPEQEKDLQKFYELRQNLDTLRMSIQQYEIMKHDSSNALKIVKDLDPSTTIYRSTGPILFQSTVEAIQSSLTDELERIEVHLASLQKREKNILNSLKEVQERLKSLGL